LSLYFKQHREEYYDLLQRVRTQGDWEGWLTFFLTGVYETASQTSKGMLSLFQEDQKKIESLGRSTGNTLQIFKKLQLMPLANINRLAQETGITIPTVTTSLRRLQELGIVREITNKHRNKLYSYTNYIYLLSEGTEAIRRR
jgi:Fic family protein